MSLTKINHYMIEDGGILPNNINSSATFTFSNVTVVNDLNVGGGAGSSGLRINTTATFSGTTFINGPLDIQGLYWPSNKGHANQILMSNGVNNMAWANIGDAVYWSLNADLLTNGFNISSGISNLGNNQSSSPLTLGVGATGNFKNSIAFERWNNTTLTHPNIVYTANAHIFHGRITATDGISFADGSVLDSVTSLPGVYAGNGIVFTNSGTNGIIINAKNSIYAGNNVTFTNSGTYGIIINATGGGTGTYTATNVTILAGTGTNVVTSGTTSTISLKQASTTQLGGIKVDGVSVIINTATGVISAVNTFTSTSSFVKSLQIITTGSGGPFVFANTSSGDITLTIDSQNFEAGLGLGLTGTNSIFNTQTVYLLPATTSTLGGIKPGNGLQIYPDGTLIGTFGYNTGTINLIADMYSNGYNIQYNAISGSALNVGSSTVSITNTNAVSIVTTSTGSVHLVTGDLLLNSKNYSQNAADGTVRFDNSLDIQAYYNVALTAFTGLLDLSGGDVRLAGGYHLNASAYESVSISSPGGNIDIIAHDTANISGNEVNITGNTVTITATNLTIGDVSAPLILAGYPVEIGPDVNHSTLYVEKIYNRAGDYAPFFPAGIQYADSTVQVTAYHSQQPGIPPPVRIIVTWGAAPGQGLITNYAGIQAALATIGSPSPIFMDGIYDLNNGHTWVYTAHGPLSGWFDENA